MPENRTACAALPDPQLRQVDEVVERLAERYAGTVALHRDVIEAAVRSGWAKYDHARVTLYRSILAERAATEALQRWFGPPARPASPPVAAEPTGRCRQVERRIGTLRRPGIPVAG